MNLQNCAQCNTELISGNSFYRGFDKTFCSNLCRQDFCKDNSNIIYEYYKPKIIVKKKLRIETPSPKTVIDKLEYKFNKEKTQKNSNTFVNYIYSLINTNITKRSTYGSHI